MNKILRNIGSQFPSGLVVFLVALPLCLGVGFASTNIVFEDGTQYSNIFSGIISGIIGGIIVGSVSGSRYGVSGPAAGLITIVSAAIISIGSFEGFLVAVLISGVIQVIAGYLKGGIIGAYFPSSVIKGMLAAIGIILILKEIPHLIGDDKDFLGNLDFFQKDGLNTFTELGYSLNHMDKGPMIIGVISLAIIILFNQFNLSQYKLFKYLPSALIVVIVGILLNWLFSYLSYINIQASHLVNIPEAQGFKEIPNLFTLPDFSYLTNYKVYTIGLVIAVIGSLESLLSAEATDKLSKSVKSTPANRELKAQGVGNMVAGMIGGLPITQVIVRSSANISAGAQNKFSTIIHGVILLVCVLAIPSVLNKIPLASLAAILMVIGYKLAKIGLFKEMYRIGWDQFLPFVITIITILFTNLLVGIGVGTAVAILFIIKNNFKNNFSVRKNETELMVIRLSEEVSFLNKGGLRSQLDALPDGQTVVIDASHSKSIDYDVLEMIHNYKNQENPRIFVQTIELPELPH